MHTVTDKQLTETLWSRARRRALWFLFAGVLLIPKTLALRRQPRTWNTLRLGIGLAGVALGAAGWEWTREGPERAWAVAAGLAFVVLALVILPERQRPSLDARTRELGALVVVKGG